MPLTSTVECTPTAPQFAPICTREKVKGAPTNCNALSEVSVHTNTALRDLTADTIFDPSCILNEPAVLVAVGTKSFVVSCEANRKNKSSCVVELPITVSVPNKNTCLSGIDTKLNLELVGVLEIAFALTPVPLDVSHKNVLPLLTVAIKSSPKLSNDQLRASIVTLDVFLGSFQPGSLKPV